MNLNLNTQQIVLLCLLVAFVTSITTGITVVSLTDQGQTPVTQTVNRIVERTIERVVEPEKDEENTTTTVTPERIIETVVVNQEDLTVDAVKKNSKSLVRVHAGQDDLGEFITLGVVVSSNSIVVDRRLINKNADYIAKTSTENIPLDIISFDEAKDFVVLQLQDGKGGLTPATFADSNSLQLAQSVISISGSTQNIISTGIVNKLDTQEKTEGENTWTEVTSIQAGVDIGNILSGSIITNLQGDIVGFKNADGLSKNFFTPANIVRGFLSERGL
jgi:S1-C subfamily serine protease